VSRIVVASGRNVSPAATAFALLADVCPTSLSFSITHGTESKISCASRNA
jgi:hypothetical protein